MLLVEEIAPLVSFGGTNVMVAADTEVQIAQISKVLLRNFFITLDMVTANEKAIPLH